MLTFSLKAFNVWLVFCHPQIKELESSEKCSREVAASFQTEKSELEARITQLEPLELEVEELRVVKEQTEQLEQARKSLQEKLLELQVCMTIIRLYIWRLYFPILQIQIRVKWDKLIDKCKSKRIVKMEYKVILFVIIRT